MSCCGGKRQALNLNLKRGQAGSNAAGESDARAARPDARLRHSGDGSLAVVGPVTGARYEFGWAGAILAVDSRDAYALAGVGTLVREP